MIRKMIFNLLLLPFLVCVPQSCEEEIRRPEVIEPLMPDAGPEGTAGSVAMSDVEQSTVCCAGSSLYRIPAILCLKDGTLLVFSELRHNSWLDKSYTDVMVKRSTDGGASWGSAINITGSVNGGNYAFMDPCPILDPSSGRIFLFCCRWNKSDTQVTNNRAFLVSSNDGGQTWSDPADVSDTILDEGMFISGFGPGHGIAVSSGKYAGRLIVVSRQYNGSSTTCRSLYSDDHGNNWKSGSGISSGEAQIAECGQNKLYMNIRKGASRNYAYSNDGGVTWSTPVTDAGLPSLDGGCQASVLGIGSEMVFYCGPKGGKATTTNDNRQRLTLYRSAVGALSWSRNKELYNFASGYSDMALMPDGRLAIIFEAGPGPGFIKGASRPAGWMRLDLFILPKEITDYDYWFE